MTQDDPLKTIEEIQAKANKEIADLKESALSAIKDKIKGLKDQIAELESKRDQLTGVIKKTDVKTRKRLSASEKTELVKQVLKMANASKDGLKLSDITGKLAVSDSYAREAIKSAGLKRDGERSKARYFVK